MNTNTICLVIPCYNEEHRLPLPEYDSFLSQQNDILICFVNDGSTDKTEKVLQKLSEKYPLKVFSVSYKNNKGKAEAVRTGMQYCLKNLDFKYIGYVDADLSTPLEESVKMSSYMKEEIEFCFGSRILKIGSIIERSTQRHYYGRIIATLISRTLDVEVYDTQCGCKLFTKDIAVYLFQDAFISTWLFDVELFARMLNKYGKQKALNKMKEIPLDKWINKDGSKVRLSYFFRLWLDLFRIKRTLKRLP